MNYLKNAIKELSQAISHLTLH